MFRVTVHIWRRNLTFPYSINNINHAAFQLQQLLSKKTATGTNIAYTCPPILDPTTLVLLNANNDPVPGFPLNQSFIVSPVIPNLTVIATISGKFGLPWIRMSKDIDSETGNYLLTILQGNGDAATHFNQICSTFDHSFEQCFYLAQRALKFNHEKAQQGLLQLKGTLFQQVIRTNQVFRTVDLETDFTASQFAQKLSAIGF